MARRSDHTREELLNIAIKSGHLLIKNDGYKNFSSRKLAKKIGYSVGTIHNIFGNYDNLILHINGKTLDDWYSSMVNIKEQMGDKFSLYDLARGYLEYSNNNYNNWSALFEFSISDGILPDWYTEKMQIFFGIAEELVLRYVNNDKNKARMEAKILWAGIHGICILFHSRKLNVIKEDAPIELANNFIKNYLYHLNSLKN